MITIVVGQQNRRRHIAFVAADLAHLESAVGNVKEVLECDVTLLDVGTTSSLGWNSVREYGRNRLQLRLGLHVDILPASVQVGQNDIGTTGHVLGHAPQIGDVFILLLRFLLLVKCDRAGSAPVTRSHQIGIGEMADENHAGQLVLLCDGAKQLAQREQIAAVLMDRGVTQFDGNRIGPIPLGAEIGNQSLDVRRQILGAVERFEDSLLDQDQQSAARRAAVGDRFECLDFDLDRLRFGRSCEIADRVRRPSARRRRPSLIEGSTATARSSDKIGAQRNGMKTSITRYAGREDNAAEEGNQTLRW